MFFSLKSTQSSLKLIIFIYFSFFLKKREIDEKKKEALVTSGKFIQNSYSFFFYKKK